MASDGLLLLSPHGIDPPAVDIIAIHGLTGDRLKTWTDDGSVCWLKDYLPQDIPAARIFSYGYDAKVFFSKSVSTVLDLSVQLLNAIDMHRTSQEEKRRPLVFICHSLGGIVCKQALSMAKDDCHFGHILPVVRILIFFGTPHQGSEYADLGGLLGSMTNTLTIGSRFTGRINTTLLGNLETNAAALDVLDMSFLKISSQLQIVSFFEGKTTRGLSKTVVEKNSAVFKWEREFRMEIPRDHKTMCKFSSREDGAYLKVVSTCQKLISEQQQETVSIEENELLNLLGEYSEASFVSSLPRTDNTCEWILEVPQFLEWLQSDTSNVLWLTGDIGCGKTTLVSNIFNYIRGVKKPNSSAICAFFCSEADVERQNFTLLMRRILSQLFWSRHDLLSKCLSLLYYDRLKRPEVLQEAFLSALRGQQEGLVFLIIDGIDQLDKTSQEQMLRLLKSFPEPSEKLFWSRVKILLSSRSPADVPTQRFQKAILNLSKAIYRAKIQEDVCRYLKDDLNFISARLNLPSQWRNRLEFEIHTNAVNFLYTSLALRRLKTTHVSRGKDLERLARETLGSLEGAYDGLLDITLRSIQDARRLLHILVTALRPLTLDEIGTAFAIDKNVSTLKELEENRHSEMKLFITGTLGPLVSIRGGTVQLVHQSLKTYLLKSAKNASDPRDMLFGTFEEAQLTMSNLCTDLLSLQELGQIEIYDSNVLGFEALPMPDSPVATAPDQRSPLERARELDFLEYASCHWAEHLARAGLSAEAKSKKVLSMVQPGSVQLQNWTEKYRHSLGEWSSLPHNVDALNLSVFFNLHDVFAYLLKDPSAWKPTQKEHAFIWAARIGNLLALRKLASKGVKKTAETLEEKTALHWAAQNGHSNAVQLILEHDPACIQLRVASQKTALMLAARNGHPAVVSMLLEQPDVDPNSADIDGWTPLMFSIGKNMDSLQLEVFETLVNDVRVSLLHRDRHDRTILSYAAEYDAHQVIAKLIKIERSDARQLFNDVGDNHYRRSPLSYAAYEGNLTSFELLLASGLVEAQVRSRDTKDQSFVIHAADRNKEGIIQITKRYHPDILDSPEGAGRTPLSAAIWGGNLNTVKAFLDPNLLRSKIIEVNKPSNSGRTPLSYAAASGREDLVKVLLENGARTDIADEDGRFPSDHIPPESNVMSADLKQELDELLKRR